MQRIGPYEVVRELGRGGMGVVYEVRHPEQERRLALKLISPELAEPEDLARFAREAELLARVRHPHVVVIHTFARGERGQPYLVTDLVEGEGLKDAVRAGLLGPTRAARIVRDLASALEALHAQGIVHRDLKPANVILRPDGAPVLLDFGLARDLGAQRLTQTGALLGTPAYMAPEQLGGPSEVDPRTDVYGLGAVLYELLTGRPPFAGSTLQVLAAVAEQEPRWPSADGRRVPPALEAVLRRCLAKAPEERYPSAAALREDLERFLAGEAVAAPSGHGWLVALGLGTSGLGALVALAALPLLPPGGHGSQATPTPSSSPSVAAVGSRGEPRQPSPREPGPVERYLALRERVSTAPGDAGAAARLEELRGQDRPLIRCELSSAPARPPELCFAGERRLLCGAPGLAALELSSQAREGGSPTPIAGVAATELGGLASSREGKVVVFGAKNEGWSYHPETGALARVTSFDGARGTILMAAISPDGQLAAFGAQDARVSVVSLADPAANLHGYTGSALGALAFHPDGTVIAGTAVVFTGGANLHRWDPTQSASKRAWRSLDQSGVGSIAIGPAGQIAVGAGGVYQDRGAPGLVPLVLPGSDAIQAVHFHPVRGEWLYAVSTRGRLLALTLDGAEAKVRWQHACGEGGSRLDVSPEGALLAVGGRSAEGSAWIEVWPAD